MMIERTAGDDVAATFSDAHGLSGVSRLRIVLLTGLGDVIHGLPVVCAIRRARPDIRVTWVVEPMPAPILEGHPAIDRVVVFRKRDGIRGVLALREALRDDPADLTLNLNIYFKSIFPTLLSPAPRRLGFDRGRVRDGVWLASTERLPARPRAHTQDMFLEFLERLGVEPDPLEWMLSPTPGERVEQAGFFDSFDRPPAAIVVASANEKKDWVPDRYVELADRLYDEAGLQPLLVGGPGTRETRIAEMVAARSRVPVMNAMGDGVRRLVWLIAGSRMLIAPDTGPVHIARALDVPVIGLYGHTNPWRVGPYRRFEDLWLDRYTEPGDTPDPSRFDPKHGRMERITVADVMEKVAVALDREESPAAPHNDVASTDAKP